MSSNTKSVLKKLKTLASRSLEKATAMPKLLYTSEEILELEQKKIFSQQWLCAGREDSIPKTGDYLTYEIGIQPIVVIRQKDNSIAAFANICRHRMMQLMEGEGNCKRIMCPYHAWTYGIDGQLMGAPYMQTRPKFKPSDYSLVTVRCEVWEGWIYVTLNEELVSVAEQLAELQEIVADYRMSSYVQIIQQDHVWNTNWKLLTENFMEGYHLPVTHRATVGGHFPVNDTRFSEKKPNPAFTYQYFTKEKTAPVGTAHRNNRRLKGDQRSTSILPTVFPSHMYSLAPDHLWYLSLQPLGVNQVRIRYGAAIAPEVLKAEKNKRKYIKDIVAFLDKVNQEDKFVVEGIHKGVNAPLSVPGPLCWLERENHEFTQYLARRLCG